MSDDWRPQHPPPPPADLERLFSNLHWHQRWEVFRGVFTPGRNDVAELYNRAGVPADLRGARVLDVGAWHGCFSFECARRGASEVIALSPEPPDQVGFDRLQAALGHDNVRYRVGSAYDLDPARLGRFDLVLFFGVLYHLRYPLLAIDRLHGAAAGPVLVETHVIDHCFIPAGATSEQAVSLAAAAPAVRDVPIWQFYRRDELGADTSNWFGPNIAAVISAFGSAGFDTTLVQQWGTRASFRAVPRAAPEYREINCYERNYESIDASLRPRET